jgi:hypothetical protein
MKSLDQIEARTAITGAGAVVISQAGSYYLTRNITVSSGDAITIGANNVTLDLNGFAISSTAPSATGRAIVLYGVFAFAAINCSGSSPSWIGLEANIAIGCSGDSGANYGVFANTIAEACFATGPFGAHRAHQYNMP